MVPAEAAASSSEDGKAEVKGKVWLRDQTEPDEWTVEMVDKSPHTSGSPGLFGNAQEAEFYVDNISVTPNESSDVALPQ